MKFLEQIQKHTPVEWKRLGEVASLKQGDKTIPAKNKTEGDIPVISSGQKPVYYIAKYNREGETITIARSGTAGYVSYWNEPIFVSDAFSVKPDLSILSVRYVFHFFLKHQNWIYNLKRGAVVPHVYPKDLANFLIPIPPLEIQREIVRILDTFTRLTAELTAELTARKKQYAYYRDQLLTFKEGEVKWKRLGEVANLKRGKTIPAKNKTEGAIPVIGGGQKPAYYTAKYNREGEIITIAGNGAYAGYVSYWNEPIFVSNAFSVKPDLSILSVRYVFHFFLKHQNWIYNLKRGAVVPHVYPKDLANFLIPIPPLEIQREIVRILDTFTRLIAELTTELTARKKQYAYYREQLLDFPGGKRK